MPFSLSQLRTMPVTVALGIMLWVLAWAGFLAVINMVFADAAKDIRNLAIAVIVLTVFLVRAANWARMISLMANLLAIVFLAFLSFAMHSVSTSGTAFMLADLVVFGAACYFLFTASTADFFKFHSRPAAEEPQSKKPKC
jgi:hypothetical protein